ncbi:MAG TPA: hypothetical protein VFQ45_17235 [Longimicrobium sp.]|nr:hypothetical protein [Longimicrobium sp.]
MASTNVLVRVQARGGKYLGPDIGYALVTLRNALSGQVLAQGLATGGSGGFSKHYTPGASSQVIVTPPAPNAADAGRDKPHDTVTWLTAPQGTAGLTATLDLEEPTLVEITAQALTNGAPNGHQATQRTWLTPGADVAAEPGIVLVMPGLNVQVLSPSLSSPAAADLAVTAWVTMMCGCKIAEPTATNPSLWLPESFEVTARVSQVGGPFEAEATLAYQAVSTFGTPAGSTIKLPGAGNYRLEINAVQAAEGNVGSATTFFSINPPPPMPLTPPRQV